jgi:hypothetical protein
MDKKVKDILRAGCISLNFAVISGCGDVDRVRALNPQELFSKDAVLVDRTGTDAWKQYLSAMKLHKAWAPPSSSPWRAYYKPTLISAVTIVESAAKPIYGSQASQAEKNAELLISHMSLENACVIVDLPGEESVAWGAVLAEKGRGLPIPTFHNWPHQYGVVPIHRALGALIYYAPSVEKATSAEGPSRKPVFLLESQRLTQKGTEFPPSMFDNRYFHFESDFPTADILGSNGIKSIYYVTWRSEEEDDLNKYFVSLAGKGIGFYRVHPGSETVSIKPFIPVYRVSMFSPPPQHEYHRTYGTGYRPYYHHFWHTSGPTFGGRSSGRSGGGYRFTGGG